MNKTGVIKVYLIGSRKYAYRLQFRRAIVPEWAISSLNAIGDRTIGFEDPVVNLNPDMAHIPADLKDPGEDNEEEPDGDINGRDNDELDEAIRVLEHAE